MDTLKRPSPADPPARARSPKQPDSPGQCGGSPSGPSPEAWRSLPAAQQPDWPDPAALRTALSSLAGAPPLVFATECDTLLDRLGEVARGKAFLLQGGDCAETLDAVSAESVRGKLEVLLQMASVLTYAAGLPVVKVGRIAGQYAKPRSRPTETRGGVTLPSYRGDAVNGRAFTAEARTPDPARLERVYHACAATLNLLRAFTAGGYADPHAVHERNRDFVALSTAGGRYGRLMDEIDAAFAFIRACGMTPSSMRTTEVFASHEALLLDYESALARTDPDSGRRYALSGHLLWIGERTRRPDEAHVAFAAGVSNPLGVKLGPDAGVGDVLTLLNRLDPQRTPGRLTFITRMGRGLVRDRLPALVEAVRAEGAQVVWVCDPMHGNTFTAPSGHKSRRFDDVLDEIEGFFEVHRALGTHPGGLHMELTGEDVTECVGGSDEVLSGNLHLRYETACDPRLNRRQSMDLAFRVAEWFSAEEPRCGRPGAERVAVRTPDLSVYTQAAAPVG
ncbi:class II 3-deoxy-7-phosphoheptulonate synthase [Streptomyces sp. NBC_00525]|uniref:class II 3-deoxy-7-phosphoheptulonate synthase n=1 Tax=Streptomyces sp. NBC_00525 TaxID=2903660 RepID=UPI002E81FD54|nr:3-deoxy-7-phosphoheptulonate synthase class II [Streptomyces sp. NBC_00525]WUC96871.1 3-deoxy-7-phosphoheptulonate synthase class II [Streptomyces sp. NBC_00525]